MPNVTLLGVCVTWLQDKQNCQKAEGSTSRMTCLSPLHIQTTVSMLFGVLQLCAATTFRSYSTNSVIEWHLLAVQVLVQSMITEVGTYVSLAKHPKPQCVCRTLLYSSEAQATLQPLPKLAGRQLSPASLPMQSSQAADSASDDSIPDATQPMFKIGIQDDAGEIYLLRYQPATERQKHAYGSTALHKPGMTDDRHAAFAESANNVSGAILESPVHISQTDWHTHALGHDVLADDDAAAPWPLFSSSITAGNSAQTQGTHKQTQHAQTQYAQTDSTMLPETINTNGHAMQSAQVSSQAACDGHIAAHNSSMVSEPNGMQLHLAVYCLAGKCFVSRQEFISRHRLIDLQDNAYVPMPRGLPQRLPPQQGSACRHEVCMFVGRLGFQALALQLCRPAWAYKGLPPQQGSACRHEVWVPLGGS